MKDRGPVDTSLFGAHSPTTTATEASTAVNLAPSIGRHTVASSTASAMTTTPNQVATNDRPMGTTTPGPMTTTDRPTDTTGSLVAIPNLIETPMGMTSSTIGTTTSLIATAAERMTMTGSPTATDLTAPKDSPTATIDSPIDTMITEMGATTEVSLTLGPIPTRRCNSPI